MIFLGALGKMIHEKKSRDTVTLIPTRTIDEVSCMLSHLPSKAQDPASKFYKAPQQPVKGT